MTTIIILVRHGQTEWNRVEHFRGRVDLPLNDIGLEQARKTAMRIAACWKPAAVYASPLSRAIQTAEKIAGACSLAVQIVDGLVDIDYGAWQGLTPAEVGQQWAHLLAEWYKTPDQARIPGGETLQEVQSRARSSVHSLCTSHPDQQIVLVSHTVVNRLILLGALGLGNHRFWHLRQDP